MTYAPDTLLDARHVYQKYTGLPDMAVGIVGDPAHRGGYHCGWDRRKLNSSGQLDDYSWEESSRDSSHKTDAASAIDFGWFEKVMGGKKVTLIDFNIWMVKEFESGAPDTLDVRSFIYTLDKRTVKRWDRLKRRTGGDNSHLSHSHLSRFRDAEKRPFAPLIQRFFNQYVGEIEMYMLKVTGNPAIYVSNGINTRLLPQGQWPLTGEPLRKAGVITLEYPTLDSLLDGGGPLVKEDSDVPPTTLTITGGQLEIGPTP